MTPVRNEAWVLPAFLKSTSLWADYIIVADQMSTDGSREIYKEYPKVIVINNTNPDFNEDERQAMLIAKAREVADGRDALLWGLDADEILSANAFTTADWKKIMQSKPGAVFFFKWAIITEDLHYYQLSSMNYPWLFHDDGKEAHGNYVRKMHSMRIPYPIDEHDINYVNDFRVLHLAWVNPFRVDAKRRFYTFLDWEINRRSVICLARTYTNEPDTTPIKLLPDEMVYSKEKDGFDIWENVRLDERHSWMDDYVAIRLKNHNINNLALLPIWKKSFLEEYKLRDPRSICQKILHLYIDGTSSFAKSIFIRAIDKILIKIFAI